MNRKTSFFIGLILFLVGLGVLAAIFLFPPQNMGQQLVGQSGINDYQAGFFQEFMGKVDLDKTPPQNPDISERTIDVNTIINQLKKRDKETAKAIETYLKQNPIVLEAVQKIIDAHYLSLKSFLLPVSECGDDEYSDGCIFTTAVFSKNSSGLANFTCGLESLYPQTFKDVFNHRNLADWSETGDWKGDWQAVNDATAMAPELLYLCAPGTKASNAAELRKRANKTVEYELGLIDRIISLGDIMGPADTELVVQALGGSDALLAGRIYYSGSSENKNKIGFYSRGLAIAPALALIYDPSIAEESPAGAVNAIAQIAYYNLSLAEITSDSLEKSIYNGLAKYLIHNNLEKYWIEDSYGGYYKSIYTYQNIPLKGPMAFEQGLPLMAGAKLWPLDKNFVWSKISKALKIHDVLWDAKSGGYWAGTEGVAKQVKFLSHNNLLVRGLLLTSKALEKAKPIEANWCMRQARIALGFINQQLYLPFDPGTRNYGIFVHDTASDWYCTGCNFLTLLNLNLVTKK